MRASYYFASAADDDGFFIFRPTEDEGFFILGLFDKQEKRKYGTRRLLRKARLVHSIHPNDVERDVEQVDRPRPV